MATSVFINEFHYDNTGIDTGEFIEIAGPAGTDLTGWRIVRYNGANGLVYATPAATETLSGVIPNLGGGFGTLFIDYPSNGLQNGAPDGFALVNALGEVEQFLSYEGTFTAVDGPAAGLLSIDIGISQTGDANLNPIGASLQLVGTGNHYEDFTWVSTTVNTKGALNTDQSFGDGGGTTATLSLTTSPTRFSEAAGANAATGTVTRTGDTTNDLIVTLASNDTTEATVPDTVTIGAGQASATFAVAAVDDDIMDGAQTVTLTASANGFSPATASLTVEDDDMVTAITKISQIQGNGALTLMGGQIVTVEAIVVGDFQAANGVQNLRGFYLQEEDSDIDDDPLTSEGLFIFDDTFGVDVSVGDLVQVTGRVAEFTSGTSSLTQLTSVSAVLVQSSGNTLPTAATINFPVMDPADLEAYEGMLVTIPDTLTVTEHFQLGRFGQVVLSSDGPTNQAGTDGRLEQFTQFNDPSISGYSDYLAEIAKRRIVLDDGLAVQNPDPIVNARGGQPLSATNTLRGGDTVAGLTGILDDRFGAANIGNYRIQPIAPVDFQPTNPRPISSPDVGGRLKVASFNVLNYFNGDGMGGGFTSSEQRGAENLVEFNRQRDKTISAILGLDADVVGVIEIENDGYGPTSAIQDLVNGLNAVAGDGTYAFIDPGTPRLGTDAIAVGFIYKPGSVTPVGTTAVLDSSVDPRFDSSANRPALAQSFTENATGEVFTAVNNHFKSKGSVIPGENDIGDGQGNNNPTRTRAAEALVDWLATDPTGVGDADYLVMGDLNAYAQEDPLTAIEAGADDLAGTADDYTNLLADSTYSFVFNGQWGSLDHALASSNLTSQVTGAAIWHINADEPNVLDYNTNFKSAGQVTSLYASDSFRSSDHDPVIVGLNLSTPKMVITGTNRRDILMGTDGNDRIEGLRGNDIIMGGDGDDIIVGGPGFDMLTGGKGRDTFVYESVNDGLDIIRDFNPAEDFLDLSAIFSGSDYGSTTPFADYVKLINFGLGNNTTVTVDPNGDLPNLFNRPLVVLEGVTPDQLSEANFLV